MRMRHKIKSPLKFHFGDLSNTVLDPSIERQFLLHVAFGIGDGGPAAEVVFEDVVAICDACGHALGVFDAAKLVERWQIVKRLGGFFWQ